MKVVNLVRGSHRPPEQGQSYMCENALLRSARRPILSLHYSVVRRGTAERDAVTLVIGPHARKRAAASDASLEVVNVRRFQVQTGRLIGCRFCRARESGTGLSRRSPSFDRRGIRGQKSGSPSSTQWQPPRWCSGNFFDHKLCKNLAARACVFLHCRLPEETLVQHQRHCNSWM